MGGRLLAQKSTDKDHASAKAIEEMSKKLVALEQELTRARQTLNEAHAREEDLQVHRYACVCARALDVCVCVCVCVCVYGFIRVV